MLTKSRPRAMVLQCWSIVALAVTLAAGCSTESSTYCKAWERPDVRLDGAEGAAGRVAAIQAVIDRLPVADRPPVVGLRDYTAVLFGSAKVDAEVQRRIVTHFLTVDAPALDRRLRRECRVPLGRLAPFAGLGEKG